MTSNSHEIDDGMMLPKYVDLTLDPIAAHCFWRGSSIEFAPRISKHRKRKTHDGPEQKELFVRKVSGRKTHGCAASSSGANDGREIARLAAENNINIGIPADDDGVDDCDYAPTDDSDVDFNNDQELEAFIAELCPSEEVATNDQDQDASMAMADLLDFFSNMEAVEEAERNDDEVHVSQDIVREAHPDQDSDDHPSAKDAADDSSDSSSSSSSSNSRSGQRGPAPSDPTRTAAETPIPRPIQTTKTQMSATLAMSGAKSSSMFDESTVWVGPIRFVKRFHPVP